MLDPKVFMKGMTQLMMCYPNWRYKPEDPDMNDAWYEVFKNTNNPSFERMVEEYIRNETNHPTVKGLMDHYADIEPKKLKIIDKGFIEDRR